MPQKKKNGRKRRESTKKKNNGRKRENKKREREKKNRETACQLYPGSICALIPNEIPDETNGTCPHSVHDSAPEIATNQPFQ